MRAPHLCLSALFSFAALFVALPATTATAAEMEVTGSLPKDLTLGRFDVTITVSKLTAVEMADGNAKDPPEAVARFVSRFKFLIGSDSTAVSFTAAEAQASSVKFFATQNGPTEEKGDAEFFTLIYNVTFEQVTNVLPELAKDGKLTMGVNFYIGNGTGTKGEDNAKVKKSVTLTQESFVVDQAPEFEINRIEGSQKSLKINWKHKPQVTIKPGAALKPAGRITAFIAEKDAVGTVQLPAKKFSGVITTADTPTTCAFTPLVAVEGACTCTDPDVYLVEEEVAKLPGWQVRSAPSSDGGLSVTGLVNDKAYVVFLQYEPDGIQRSICTTGQPSPNFSLTELNGEGDAEVVDFRCFIATAAYGTHDHEDIDTFRAFRDQHLKKNAVGRALVDAYYELSPPVADFIANHPDARDATRWTLEKIATLVRTVEED